MKLYSSADEGTVDPYVRFKIQSSKISAHQLWIEYTGNQSKKSKTTLLVAETPDVAQGHKEGNNTQLGTGHI